MMFDNFISRYILIVPSTDYYHFFKKTNFNENIIYIYYNKTNMKTNGCTF